MSIKALVSFEELAEGGLCRQCPPSTLVELARRHNSDGDNAQGLWRGVLATEGCNRRRRARRGWLARRVGAPEDSIRRGLGESCSGCRGRCGRSRADTVGRALSRRGRFVSARGVDEGCRARIGSGDHAAATVGSEANIGINVAERRVPDKRAISRSMSRNILRRGSGREGGSLRTVQDWGLVL